MEVIAAGWKQNFQPFSKAMSDDSSMSQAYLAVPLIDDTIIANLDNVISKFQDPHFGQSEADLRKSLDELKSVKELLQKFNDQAISSADTSFASGDAVQASIEMLENGGKFVNPIGGKESSDGLVSPLYTSSRKSSKVPHKYSVTSLKNSMSVAPCKFSPLAGKKLSPVAPFIRKQPKRRNEKRDQRPLGSAGDTAPKITQTFHAKCRIHRYDDSSHTFEVLQPRSVTRGDNVDDNSAPSELVIVLLANGETALFTSKHCSLLDRRYQGKHIA